MKSVLKSSYHVLVVDDDAATREVLFDVLCDAGWTARTADDGESALQLLQADECPSVIVLDLQMPRVDGRHFLEHLRANEAWDSIVVIPMTAGRQPMAAPTLRKPFDLDELLGEIRAALGQAEPQTKNRDLG